MSRFCINCTEDHRVTQCTSICGEKRIAVWKCHPPRVSDRGVPVPVPAAVLPAKAPPAPPGQH